MSNNEKKSPVALVLTVVVLLLLILIGLAVVMLSGEGGRQSIENTHTHIETKELAKDREQKRVPSTGLEGQEALSEETLDQKENVESIANESVDLIDQEQFEAEILSALRSGQPDQADQLFEVFRVQYPDAVLTSRYSRLKSHLIEKTADQ